MAAPHSNHSSNRLLACLPAGALNALQPHLFPIELNFRQRLEQPNRPVEAAVFMESGLASVVATSGGERRQAEVAIVGREGMTGLPIVLGNERAGHDVFIQVPGKGYKIAAEDLRRLLSSNSELYGCLLRYVHCVMVQIGHTALASAQATIEQRLARWLLMAQDRLQTADIALTHDLLALMLGVRRAGVTTGLHQLERRNFIQIARGNVIISDREGLRRTANGFYGGPESEYERATQAIAALGNSDGAVMD